MRRINRNALAGDLLLQGVWEGLGRPECHLTGGYLRDRLLGRFNNDIDLVLPGTIEQTRASASRLAARLDTRAHVLGRGPKRVWRIESSDLTIELWPLGRMTLEKDIARRDFTVNALVYPLPSGPLVDRVGGLEDLGRGVLKALAESNLHKDPVRLIRAARFVAQFDGFEIDPTTASWIRSSAPLLAAAPRERVGQELTKMLRAEGVARGLRALGSLDLLVHAAPQGSPDGGEWLDRNLAVATRLAVPANHPVPVALREAGDGARLVPLFLSWGNPDEDSLSSYAWAKKDRRHAQQAANSLGQALAAVSGPPADRRSLIHATGTAFPTVLAVAAAIEPELPWRRWWRLWRERGSELVHPVPLLTGNEIAEISGFPPGPELGRAVDALAEAQVRAEFRSRAGAVRWLRNLFTA